jgi:hypothetical protein
MLYDILGDMKEFSCTVSPDIDRWVVSMQQGGRMMDIQEER